MTYISRPHSYVSLLCKRERQALIRRAPLSSDNSCVTVLYISVHFPLLLRVKANDHKNWAEWFRGQCEHNSSP